MTEDVTEPTANPPGCATPHLTLRDQELAEQFRRLGRYFHREPAMALTLVYLITSMVGLLQIILLLAKFDINVMPHLELTDLMLAAVHHPLVMFYYLSFLLAIAAGFYLDKKLLRRWSPYCRWVDRFYEKSRFDRSLTFLVVVLVMYMGLAAMIESGQQSRAIREGHLPRYQASLATPVMLGDQSVTQLANVQVIANLSKYLWLYDHGAKQVVMVPHESLLLLMPPKLSVADVSEEGSDGR